MYIAMLNSICNKNVHTTFTTMLNKVGLTYFTLWGAWGGTILYTKSILWLNKNSKITYNALLHSGIIGGIMSYHTYNRLFLPEA